MGAMTKKLFYFSSIFGLFVALLFCVPALAIADEVANGLASTNSAELLNADQLNNAVVGDTALGEESNSTTKTDGKASANTSASQEAKDPSLLDASQTSKTEDTSQKESISTSEASSPVGTYNIASGLSSKKVTDAKGGSTTNGTPIQIYDSNETDAQVWSIKTTEDGYSSIYQTTSGKALDVAGGNAYSGAKVQLYASNGTLAQKWIITSEGDNLYKIASALNKNYVLDLAGASLNNGSLIRLWIDNGTKAQRWSLSATETVRQKADRLATENRDTLADGTYTLDTLLVSGKSIDIPGGTTTSGTKLQIYTTNNTSAQAWTISHDSKGYITIKNTDSGLALDVLNANAASGAKIQLYSSNNTWAQKWIAIATDKGFVLLSAINTHYALDVAGASTKNGTRLQLYVRNNTKAQQWNTTATTTVRMRLNELAQTNASAIQDGTYALRSELLATLVLDAKDGSTTNGTAIQTYTANNTKAQYWKITHDKKGYLTIINVASGKALDVKSASASNGATIQLYDSNGTWAQKWIAVPTGKAFTLISGLSDTLALDIKSGVKTNSTAIQLYKLNNTSAQNWYFTKAEKGNITVKVSSSNNSILPIDIGFGDYVIALPSYASNATTNLSFNKDVTIAENASVITSGTTVLLSDYVEEALSDIIYTTIKNASGTVLSNLFFMKSEGMTSIFVTSEDPISHGRTWVESSSNHSNVAKGTINVVASTGASIYDGVLSQIKGRGNSSWTLAKKPYQIKLDKKTDLLQTGDKSNKAKTWVLLSGAYDQTCSRNVIAYSYAQLMGVSSAVEFALIDLYYDGEYRGTYLLSEKVQIGSGRVDITDLEEENENLNPDIDNAKIVVGKNSYGMEISYGKDITNPTDITGGYLIEHERDSARYTAEKGYFAIWDGTTYQHFVCKSPEVWSYAEANYMSCFLQDLFDAFNNNGVVPDWRGSSRAGMKTTDLLDVNSLAMAYWVNELMKNGGGYVFSSGYLYKDSDSKNSKLYFGPAWDFDLSSGNPGPFENNAELAYTDGWYTRAKGLANGYMNDPYVKKAINDSQDEAIATLREYLNKSKLAEQMATYNTSLRMNEIVWGGQTKTWQDVKTWVNKRANWIESC